MNTLMPLLLLLGTAVVNSAGAEPARPAMPMAPAVTARVVGAPASRSTSDDEILVLDTFSFSAGAGAYTFTASTPRTYMGMPFHIDPSTGEDFAVDKIVVYPVYTGETAIQYTTLRTSILLWDAWSESSIPVFAVPQTFVVADLAEPISFEPNTLASIEFSLSSPVAFSALQAHAFSISYEGDSGAGLQSSENLTSTLRVSDDPLAVGDNASPDHYGYRNASGREDFNFLPDDAKTVNLPNQAIAIQMYARPGYARQAITNFVATPAHPTVANGSFSVAATGGASGNPVTFWVETDAVCTAGGTNGQTISIVGGGTCIVHAAQDGNGDFSGAPLQTLYVFIAGGDAIFANGFQ